MRTHLLRFSVGAPLVAIAMLAFSIALLVEWLADRARSCPHPENIS